jgi:nicotinamidase-related amidase
MLKVIETWESVARKVNRPTRAANALRIPILLTGHYKNGLGETITEVIQEIRSPRVFQKEHFSACPEADFHVAIDAYQRGKIVLVGMKTYLCVLQTGPDLPKAGYQVHLVADAVDFRTSLNRDIAIAPFREAGAVIASAEIVMFQWARRANTDDFREILPIVK